MRVTVCRDAVSGKCLRNACKFYHLPIVPPVTMAANFPAAMSRWMWVSLITHTKLISLLNKSTANKKTKKARNLQATCKYFDIFLCNLWEFLLAPPMSHRILFCLKNDLYCKLNWPISLMKKEIVFPFFSRVIYFTM